jgi:hypothetical protein
MLTLKTLQMCFRCKTFPLPSPGTQKRRLAILNTLEKNQQLQILQTPASMWVPVQTLFAYCAFVWTEDGVTQANETAYAPQWYYKCSGGYVAQIIISKTTH